MFQKIFNKIFDNILESKDNKQEIVYVIGNGWGSYYFVKNLDKNKYCPVIIAPNVKVLNTPKLTNLLIEPYTEVTFENPYGEIIKDMVEDIDTEKKNIITKKGYKYPYNKIVMSIGSEPNDFGIEGVGLHTYKFKTKSDAIALRYKIESQSINSMIYVIGSGITGIEIASKLNNIFNVKVIEGMENILPGYNEFIRNYLKQKIDIDTNTMVKSIENDKMKLLKTKTNENIECKFSKQDIIIWSGGIRFNGYGKSALYNSLNKITPIKPRGLNVLEDFSIKEDLNIYCIGDMVANKGPSSAQNARIQGEYLAKYFNSGFDKKFLKTNKFESTSKGKIVHLLNETYFDSKYYSGFIPKCIDNLIEWINLHI